jgi:hypothetical protein
MRSLIALLLLLLPSLSWAQIDLPPQVNVGEKLVAAVTATIPEGATFDGGWQVRCKDGADCLASYEPLAQPNSIGIWAPAGEYQVSYTGFWILLKEIKFKDGDGNEVVITSYLGHGLVNESASVVVGTPVPPPPPPPPTPSGPWRIWFLEEPNKRDNLPQPQQALLVSQALRERLQREGHQFQEVVQPPSITTPPARLQAIVAAFKASGIPLPAIALTPLSGELGAVKVFALPADEAGLMALLAKPEK